MSTPYQFRVHVIEARGLAGKNPSGFSDPIAFVTIRGEEKHTIVIKETTSAYWDHLFFWEMELSEADMLETKIKIEVKDEGGGFSGDTLIGLVEIDADYVRRAKDHEIYKTWAGLSNPQDPSESAGNLRFSAGIFGPEDEPVTHDEEDEEGGDPNDLSAAVLTNQELEYQYFKLLVRVYRCENLSKVDALTGSDTFVSVNFGGRFSTKTIRNSLNPSFNTELAIPAKQPSMSDNIRITIEDYNLSGNVLIGDVNFTFRGVKQEAINPTYFHLYGDPVEADRYQNLVNSLSEVVETNFSRFKDSVTMAPKKRRSTAMESAYRGTVLLGLEVVETDKPAKSGTRTAGAPQIPPDELWTLWFDLYEATEIPDGGGMSSLLNLVEAQVIVSIGPHEVSSTRMALKSGTCKWYDALEETKIRLPSDPKQVPDIFVNIWIINTVVRTKTRVGFLRIPATSVRNFDCNARWKEPEMDPKLIGENTAGFLLFGIGFGPSRTVGDAKRERVKKLPTKKYQMRIHVYQAKNLTPSDLGGTSDAYVIARCAGMSQRTGVKYLMNAPRWYTTLSLDVDLAQPLTLAPDCQVIVMDEDQVVDDMIGRCTLKTSRMDPFMPELPKWYNIYAQDKRQSEGQLLLSCQLIPVEDLSKNKLTSITPKCRDCIVEMDCIGVRGLLPYMYTDVAEPYLEFVIGEKSENNKAYKRTKASTNPNGPNANFLETVAISVPLPENPIFAPSLDLSVMDIRLTPVNVAVAGFWLGEHCPWATEDAIEEYHKVEDEESDEEQEIDEGIGLMFDVAAANEECVDEEMLEGARTFEKPAESNQDKKQKKRKKGPGGGGGGGGGGVARSGPEVPVTEIQEEESDGTEGEEKENPNKPPPEPPTLDDELEGTLTDLPFHNFSLMRGMGTQSRSVGTLKGNIRVIELKNRARVKTVNIKEKYRPKLCKVRVYVLRGIKLSPANSDGSANPYLIVKIGDGTGAKIADTLGDVKEDTLEPDFYKGFELTGKIPGDSELVVQVMNYSLAMNTLVGETKIDLENRYFSEQWRALKPMWRENRTLRKPGSATQKGKVEMWVEILTPEDALATPLTLLKAPLPTEWQLRVVVWHTFDVPMEDGSIEVYVSGEYAGEDQFTDTHRGITDGQGNFNWRMVWDISLPDKKVVPRLKFAIWDSNIFSNEAIGEVNLSLKPFFTKAVKKNSREGIKRQTIPCRLPSRGDEMRGKIDLQIDLLPMADARDSPVGKGRGKPNQDPELPEPERPSLFDLALSGFSFDLFGFGAMKKKCAICCLIVVVVLVVFMMIKP